MKRRSSPISSRISDGGRDQFSELNEKMVRMPMPRSPAARTVRRNASTPRRCPSARGRPRAAAQRPLPSMMMATCRGMVNSPIGTVGGAAFDISIMTHTVRISFSLPASILSISPIVSSVSLLHLLGGALVVVLADLVILFQLLEHIKPVAPDVAHRDPGGLGIFVRHLDQVLAPLFVELRDAQPQHLPLGRGREAEMEAAIAFSTACTIDRSQTCTEMRRGSGTLTVAS